MIETKFNGESGNNLFQYFLSACVALEKKYAVHFIKSNRGNTFKEHDGYFIFNGLKLPSIIEGNKQIKNPIEFKKHIFNWESAINHEGKIKLNGFFQNYSYYRSYKTLIKKIILENNNIFDYKNKPGNNDLVLHLRFYDHVNNLPISYYENLIESGNYDTIWLVSKEKNKYINILYQKYNNVQFHGKSCKDDFLFMCNATYIGLSQSTFSWWASFISKAKEIFIPLVDNREKKCLWYNNPKKGEINLFVDDEYRYKKIKI